MATKDIQEIFSGASPHMVGDGFRVSNYIPGSRDLTQETSPFLMLDYNPPWAIAPGEPRKGVGAHPHKGFETVTLVYEGQLAHRDSAGGGGEIGAGDIQWMTAGSGLLHEEFQAESFRVAGGTQHMAQIWVNLPARNKNAPPTYQSITSEKIDHYVLDGQEGKVRVIAGNFKGIGGAARTFTPVEMYDIRLKEGAKLEFDLPASYNSMLLVTQGEWLVNGRDASFKDFVLFGHQGDAIQLTAKTDGSVLVLSGEPINEPVASYGPFVMNTQDEIVQAMKDYRTGKFGTL